MNKPIITELKSILAQSFTSDPAATRGRIDVLILKLEHEDKLAGNPPPFEPEPQPVALKPLEVPAPEPEVTVPHFEVKDVPPTTEAKPKFQFHPTDTLSAG